MSEPIDKESFNKAFAVLEKNATALRDSKGADIDQLVSIVKESVDAYQVCKSRLDGVDAALKQVFMDVEEQ